MGLPDFAIYLLTFLWTAVTGCGVVLFMFGVRGRVVDHHLRCMRCHHVYVNGGIDPSRCTECGGNLSEPGSLRIGKRRFNEAQLVFSIMLLAASAAVVFGVVRHRSTQTLLAAAPTAAINKLNAAMTPMQFAAVWSGAAATNDIYYDDGAAPVNNRSNARSAGDASSEFNSGALLRPLIGGQQQLIQSDALSTATTDTDSRPSDLNTERRQRPGTTTSAETAMDSPIADWLAAPTDWLSDQFDTGATRSRLTSSPTSSMNLLRLNLTDNGMQQKPIESSIATGWSGAISSPIARPVRSRVSSNAVKPVAAGSGSVSTGRGGGRTGGR